MGNRLLIVSLLFLSACFGSQNISNTNLSAFYRSAEQAFHPEFYVHRFSPDSALLYVKMDTRELLYVNNHQNAFVANLKIVCRLLDTYETPVAHDTVIRHIFLPKPEPDQSLKVFTLGLKIPAPQSYLLEVTLQDVKKNTSEVFFTPLDAGSDFSRDAYIVSRAHSTVPYFGTAVASGDSLVVRHMDPAVSRLWVKYYHRSFPLAAPPFSFDISTPFDYRYDSLFTVETGQSFTLEREGFYHFLVDSSRTEGLTLFRFGKGFPDVTSTDVMIEAVRYLVSRREFDELTTATDPKGAIDRFWMTAGGNQERSRNLIRKYYGRVQEANRFFTSFTDGWRTDRGMIYVVFGAPHIVYRSSVNESWVYGQAGNPISLSFSFNKVSNPFTDNDYTLSRAPVYEANWHQAVDVWRQGRVYNDFN
jgi:GWxTD domain-containing protein